MRIIRISSLLSVFLATLANAQVLQYHIEIVEPSTGWVAFSNDSPVAVEAYHVTAGCGPAGMSFSDDLLSTPGDRLGYAVPSGWTVPDHLGVRAYERVATSHHLLPQASGCSWQSKVDGVIFADGQFRGDTAVVEMMQAFRKGMMTALLVWKSRLDDLHSNKLSLRDADIAATIAGSTPYCVAISKKCGLGAGEKQVNNNLLLWAKDKADDGERFSYILGEIRRWQKKFNADAAYKQTDANVPTLD